MLWRRFPEPLSIPPSAPVPDAEALRRAALQASWRRDRWVARRRVWLRWLLWASGRYLMPALVVVGLGAWLWLGVLPDVGNPLQRLAVFKAQPIAATPAPPAAAPTTPTVPAPYQPDPISVDPEAGFPESLYLRFETHWATSTALGSTPTTAAASATSALTPHLKPENWLHSKEP